MGILAGRVEAGDKVLTDSVASFLRGQDDPTRDKGTKLRVTRVLRVYEPDERGLREVLFLTPDDEPMTAWITEKPRRLVSLGDDW